MKLYLLTQTEHNGYDTYDACIVCAENEEDAKTISPVYNYDTKDNTFREDHTWDEWASKIEFITCKEIGEANSNIPRGLILDSYNAG